MSELTQVVTAAHPPAQPLAVIAREYAITVAVAVAVFLVAYDNGGFGQSTRDTLAIVLWWVLILCIALGVWPLAQVTRGAWITGGLLTLFGLWTLLSVFWAADAAGAYAEFARVMLYLAVFLVAVVASRRDNVGRWCDGLALGIVGVMVVAMVSRLFPGSFEQPEIAQLLGAVTRLSFPIGYWNGLAILLALGLPLLFRGAVAGRNPLVRSLAVFPLPAFAGAIYLTSSRAGVASAVVSTVAFALLTARRWAAVAVIAVAGAGSAAVVLALYHRHTLVNGPIGSTLAVSQGHSAALIVTGICLLTGLLYGVGCKALEGRVRASPLLGWALFVAVAALVVVGIAAAHPVRRLDAFKNPNLVVTSNQSGIEQHLLSPSGNGRWQLWSSAIDEFESKPAVGRGAGSFQSWWLQHGSLPLFVQDAHSLYAEILGELGVIGFLLLAGTFAAGLGVAAARMVHVERDQRIALAALTSAFLAFAVAAGVDWMWELTIVPAVALACLGLATGPATALVSRPRLASPGARQPRGRLRGYAVGVGVIVVGWLVICAIAIPLLAGARLSASQSAAARGDLRTAVRRALGARDIQPWASSPYLQLALLEEKAGNYATARRWIRRAIARDGSDYQLWLLKSRIETELGAIRAARMSLERVRELNPRLRIFQGT